MKADLLKVVAPDRQEHREAMFDLISKVFSGGGYFAFQKDCREGYIDHSHYDWDASRIGFIGDEMVTHYGVWNYQMRVGNAKVRVGGIGSVATHDGHRRKGLMARTIPHSLNAMRDLGYDMTILFGIRNFYHKFGYRRAWNTTQYTVSVADLPSEKPRHKVSKLALRQTPDVCRLYNTHDAGATGTAVRPTYERVAWQGRWTGHGWKDRRGRLAGWVLVEARNDRLDCMEAVGDTEQLLRVLTQLARRRGARKVHFVHFPDTDPIIIRLKRGNVSAETHYHKSGGAMVRTVNLASSIRRLTGEFARRLKASYLDTWRGKLLITDAREKVLLDINRSKVNVGKATRTKHAVRGGNEIVQLLIGTDEPGEVVDAAGIRLTGDAKKLVEVLFPNRCPCLRPWDRY